MTAAAAARSILTQLHDVMASRNHAQGKLNRVVDIIGENLDSEVCSIYLLRDGMLELFATRGLNQSAVHVTKLAVGAGLTGTIAQNIETLNLAEAATHPEFQYRPETGEERFHSFAGVPIVRRERAIGVLTVQHRDPRRYDRPDELDVRRPDIRPLSFGGGPHYCIGAALARLEARIAFERLLARTASLELATDRPAWRPQLSLRALKELPISLRPA